MTTGTAAMPAAAIDGAVAATRAVLRLDGDGEAALLATLADSALALAEAFLGQRVIVRTASEAVAATGAWQCLRGMPVIAIDGVSGDGGAAVPAAAYAVDIDADGRGWVRVAPGVGAMVTVAYRAGLAADWAGVPAPIAQGVAVLAAHLFEDRAAATVPPAAVTALWRPWRRIPLAATAR